MERYVRLAATFGFGFFVTFGVLALANVMGGWPRTVELASVIALLGGLGALAAGVASDAGRHPRP